MIDLSYKKPEEIKEEEINPFFAGLGMVIFSVLLAVVFLSAIAGEPIF